MGEVGRKARPATMTSRAMWVSKWRRDDGEEGVRELHKGSCVRVCRKWVIV